MLSLLRPVTKLKAETGCSGNKAGKLFARGKNCCQAVLIATTGREEIRSLLLRYGITEDRNNIAHCLTGIRSSYATLVLLGLGYASDQNYDGSWIEWANNRTFAIQEALIAMN